jgi:hypothetical protein
VLVPSSFLISEYVTTSCNLDPCRQPILCQSPVSATVPFLVSSPCPKLASDSLSVPCFCDHAIPCVIPRFFDHSVPCVIRVPKAGERFFISPPFLRPCRSCLVSSIPMSKAGKRFFVSPPYLRPCRSLCHPRVQDWRAILCQSPVSATMPFLVSSSCLRLVSDSLLVPRFCDRAMPSCVIPVSKAGERFFVSPPFLRPRHSLCHPRVRAGELAVPYVIFVSVKTTDCMSVPVYGLRSLCHPRVRAVERLLVSPRYLNKNKCKFFL